MNVILESEKGDELVCIQSFLACPDGIPFTSAESHKFHVGDRVKYLSFRRNARLKDSPAGWQVVFTADDGKDYTATQTFFVTKECWKGLKEFFARKVYRETNSPKPPKS
jgi:hypothetical protein